MMLAVAAALSTAWLMLLAPWRVPPRPLADVPRPRQRVRPRLRTGGPVWGAVVATLALLVHPAASVPVLAWPSWQRWSAQRRHRVDVQEATLRGLPETVDLIALGVGAGLSARAAVAQAAAWVGEPYRSVFAESLRRADAGETFAVALDAAAAELDPAGRPLIALLVAADVDGGALLAGLDRVGDEARQRRRSTAEVKARRLPVTMLLPLVLCVLPAFALLGVAPLVFSALDGLDLGFSTPDRFPHRFTRRHE